MKNKKQKYALSRQKRNILLLSAFLLLAAIAVTDRLFFAQHGPVKKTAVKYNSDKSDKSKYHGKTFTIVNVVDGDTVDINSPDGKFKNTRIRLLGVDTPETDKSPNGQMYFGNQASEFVRLAAMGKKVTVITDEISKIRDKYNRLLCYLKFEDGRILNELLITEGFGYADRRFEHGFYNEYIELEKTAIAQKKGLWENITPKQMPKWRRKIALPK